MEASNKVQCVGNRNRAQILVFLDFSKFERKRHFECIRIFRRLRMCSERNRSTLYKLAQTTPRMSCEPKDISTHSNPFSGHLFPEQTLWILTVGSWFQISTYQEVRFTSRFDFKIEKRTMMTILATPFLLITSLTYHMLSTKPTFAKIRTRNGENSAKRVRIKSDN